MKIILTADYTDPRTGLLSHIGAIVDLPDATAIQLLNDNKAESPDPIQGYDDYDEETILITN